jgi:uncharacterized protein GlcG (DUF336 family)
VARAAARAAATVEARAVATAAVRVAARVEARVAATVVEETGATDLCTRRRRASALEAPATRQSTERASLFVCANGEAFVLSVAQQPIGSVFL